jgi:hypothetical protein
MEIENILKRKDKFEIVGNFLTSYSSSLGAGSLNIWDGKGENFDHCSPLDGSDANFFIISPEGRKSLYITNYCWSPYEIKVDYISYRRTYIRERKTVWEDIFVDILYISNETDCRFKIVAEIVPRMVYEKKDPFLDENIVIEEKPFYEYEFNDNTLCLYERNSVHRDFYKFFSFNLKSEFKKKGNIFSLEIPLTLTSSIFDKHVNWKKIVFVSTYSKEKRVGEEKLKKALENPEMIFENRRRNLDDFFKNKIPGLETNLEYLKKIYYFCNYVSWSNVYDFKEGNFKNPYTCPSKFRLLPQWFWDSAFHSIYEKYINTEISITSLRNIIQNQTEEGHLPFTLAIDKVLTKELIQPFILPIAVWDIYLKRGKKEIIEEFLPAIIKFDRYLEKYRMIDGLVYLKIPGESGWDNSRRYIPEPPFVQKNSPMIKENRYIISPDFNTYVYIGRFLIKKMAEELNKEEIYKEYEIRGKELKKRIESLWDEKIGLFLDKYIDGEKIYVKTPGGMIPLLAFPSKKISKIIEHLINPEEFWTEYPVPTLSLDDPYFNAEDEYQSYWNGRVWPNINWLLIETLVRNKRYKEARILIEKTIKICIASGEPQCYENYNSFTGLPYITHNIFNYGWGGIFNDILIRRVFGVQMDGRKNILYFFPFLFPLLKNFEIKNLSFGKENFVDIYFKDGKFKIKSDEKIKVIYGDKVKEGKEITGKIERIDKISHFLDI